jgi:hypothetical protein
VRQGDEKTCPYGLLAHCPRSVLLQPPVRSLFSLFSPLAPCSKKILEGDLGKGTHESTVELLVVAFYHRGKFSEL